MQECKTLSECDCHCHCDSRAKKKKRSRGSGERRASGERLWSKRSGLGHTSCSCSATGLAWKHDTDLCGRQSGLRGWFYNHEIVRNCSLLFQNLARRELGRFFFFCFLFFLFFRYASPLPSLLIPDIACSSVPGRTCLLACSFCSMTEIPVSTRETLCKEEVGPHVGYSTVEVAAVIDRQVVCYSPAMPLRCALESLRPPGSKLSCRIHAATTRRVSPLRTGCHCC